VHSRPGDAEALLTRSVEQGATLLAIGPFTNVANCGALSDATVVCMGGWVEPPAEGLPQWGADMDWNVQCDTSAAIAVFETARELTLVTFAATLSVHVRRRHLARLGAAGPVGVLLARQAEAHRDEHDAGTLARGYRLLPDDLCNFQYDAVAAAVAFGWNGATITEMRLRPVLERAVLRFVPDTGGRTVRVVTDVDADAFTETWLRAVEHI
jgi:inosine-uridine nucleoside N-ribohydrolase